MLLANKITIQKSLDGEVSKNIYNHNGHYEMNVISFPEKNKVAACLSCQIGCLMRCSFCNFGNTNFIRNLSKEEIIEQIDDFIDSQINTEKELELSFMGSGEPILNIENIFYSIDYSLQNYPIKKINISTLGPIGWIDKIKEYSLENNIHLQYSLHSTDNLQREELFRSRLERIDISLSGLMDLNTTKYKPTINYLLFDGINDSLNDALELYNLLNQYDFKLKISSYNKVPGSFLNKSVEKKQRIFIDYLRNKGLFIKSFISKGTEIKSGCGQSLVTIDS